MQPLTPDQLKTMGGQPVWMKNKDDDYGEWVLVSRHAVHVMTLCGFAFDITDCIERGQIFYPSPPTVWHKVEPGDMPKHNQRVWFNSSVYGVTEGDFYEGQFYDRDMFSGFEDITHWCDRPDTTPEPPEV